MPGTIRVTSHKARALSSQFTRIYTNVSPEIHNKPMARLFAGTSGFAYAQWKPRFYPAKLPANKFLEHYAQRLNSVEINYTFRRMPSAATLESGWLPRRRDSSSR